jgi:hypothetical protein
LARRFFMDADRGRELAPAADRQRICFSCPQLLDFRDFRGHVACGGDRTAWAPPHDSNVRFNYFWERKRHLEGAAPSGDAPAR